LELLEGDARLVEVNQEEVFPESKKRKMRKVDSYKRMGKKSQSAEHNTFRSLSQETAFSTLKVGFSPTRG